MMQNYFIVNGKKYYSGSIFILNCNGKQMEASFICYDPERTRYIYKINGRNYNVLEQTFKNNFITITDKIDSRVSAPAMKTKRDRDISGLPLGWLWYIFLMLISVIFKGAICIWIFISIVFFNWRSKKIKEEGTYIEW